ncbi:transposable element Tcb1 transposase [Trichonephila clavipes]|nr:transposable element Tcb1 transposase [Trichonephila clavipes]
MAWIVRHNYESVREGYIRNGGEEVKLFKSAVKAFQCNNRVVMAQRKHLDDFLRGRFIGRLKCVSRCYSAGRNRVSTPNEFRCLAVTVKKKQTEHSITPISCVPLTATYCRLQLIWSREHALWVAQQWCCVMFSYESKFSLQSDSRRTLIWRAPGTRYHQENTIERHGYGGAR